MDNGPTFFDETTKTNVEKDNYYDNDSDLKDNEDGSKYDEDDDSKSIIWYTTLNEIKREVKKERREE